MELNFGFDHEKAIISRGDKHLAYFPFDLADHNEQKELAEQLVKHWNTQFSGGIS